MKSTQLKSFIAISVLLAGLSLALYVSRQPQVIDNRALGTSEVDLVLVPTSGTLARGDIVTINVSMKKLATRTITASGAEANLTLSNHFVINSVTCLPPFDGLKITSISGQQVSILCTIPVSDPSKPPQPITSTPLSFAQLSVTIPPLASLTTNASIQFTKTRVTEAGIPGQSPDVSTGGTHGAYSIANPSPTPTNTPTPTLTPTPTATRTPTPTVTPSPTPTITPSLTPTNTPIPTATKTPTPTPIPCPNGIFGNLDCSLDRCIDTADFELFRQAFGKQLGTLNIPVGHHTPNLLDDSVTFIDTGDFGIFSNNFGTCRADT